MANIIRYPFIPNVSLLFSLGLIIALTLAPSALDSERFRSAIDRGDRKGRRLIRGGVGLKQLGMRASD